MGQGVKRFRRIPAPAPAEASFITHPSGYFSRVHWEPTRNNLPGKILLDAPCFVIFAALL